MSIHFIFEFLMVIIEKIYDLDHTISIKLTIQLVLIDHTISIN